MLQARKALADRQKDLEVKTQQLEIKLSNKHEEDIKKARRKSTQAGQNQNHSRTSILTTACSTTGDHMGVVCGTTDRAQNIIEFQFCSVGGTHSAYD